jgi:hypothetical protein
VSNAKPDIPVKLLRPVLKVFSNQTEFYMKGNHYWWWSGLET